MITVDSQIVTRFEKILELRRIPLVLRSEYRKWLRYFLDFQSKYAPSTLRSVQVRLFSEKLRSKGQTEAQVRQAADAVSLFFTSQQKMSFAASVAGPGSSPATVQQGLPEQLRRVGDLPYVSVVKESILVCTPPGPPASDELTMRRKGRFDDWRCLKKTAHPAWDNIIAALAGEIKARHYSRKTLQHYAIGRENIRAIFGIRIRPSCRRRKSKAI